MLSAYCAAQKGTSDTQEQNILVVLLMDEVHEHP